MRRFVWPLIGALDLVAAVWLIDRAQGPDVGTVTLNGVPGTVTESFGRTTAFQNGPSLSGYATTTGPPFDFAYTGSPTWVSLIFYDNVGGSSSTGGPPGQVTIPPGQPGHWARVWARVYWDKQIYVVVEWQLSAELSGLLVP